MILTITSTLAGDLLLVCICGAIIETTKQTLIRTTFPKIAQYHFGVKDPTQQNLFSKQLWGFVWHTMMFIFEVTACLPTDFWPSIYNPYGGTESQYTFHPQEHPSLPIQSVYLVQMGYYIFELLYQIPEPNKTKDMHIQIIHHFTALLLIILSSPYLPCYQPHLIYGYKIGLSVLILHEVTDIFYYAAKSFHYAGRRFKDAAAAFFLMHLLVWICARLVYFPRVIYGGYIYKDNYLRWQYYPALSFTSILYVMHVYWTYLMLKIIYSKTVKGKPLGDDRDTAEIEAKKAAECKAE